MGHSRHGRLCAALLVVTLAGALAAAAPAFGAPVPRSFFGVVVDRQMLDDNAPVNQETAVMRATGVGAIRLPFHWSAIARHPTWEHVPAGERARFVDVGGRPFDLRKLDRWVVAAARHRMKVLPVVVRAPWYAAANPFDPGSPVADMTAWSAFLRMLVERYGPGGHIWRTNRGRDLPIRDWQIWNEPNISTYWTATPWAAEYVKLLRTARTAVKGADPGARIVLAGLPNEGWASLGELYDAGARGAFDVAAIHPYTAGILGVLELTRRARAVMARNGDRRKPLMITEMGWTSGAGKVQSPLGWNTTSSQQAVHLAGALTALSNRRRDFRIEGVSWYNWFSPDSGDDDVFLYAGLRRPSSRGIVGKPALQAFKRTIRRLRHAR